jgi:malate dehydrogenase
MVPLPRFTNVGGIPVTELMSLERLNELVERTKGGGGEIVEMMGTSSYYAAAAAILQMVEAIIRDKKRILPCAALCQGEYGVDGIFVGVPCVLGSGGVEKIIEVGLEADERAAFETSANHVRELVEVVRTLFPELA